MGLPFMAHDIYRESGVFASGFCLGDFIPYALLVSLGHERHAASHRLLLASTFLYCVATQKQHPRSGTESFIRPALILIGRAPKGLLIASLIAPISAFASLKE
ncbi:hypothetical protein [Pseudomonas sp. MSSRFD41]|uniref:hypothetical protein n=1 Tax=Pseudomonas sp. MSSRFD41 TaxID=1310370 RepID=UPI0021AD99E7|nr:hypothetical protein [Pseudomonas sp. MSSRFD41]